MDHHRPHHHHRHHHGDRREEEEYPPPPPQPFGEPPPPPQPFGEPPPPQVFHSTHQGPGPAHGYPGPPPGPDAFFPHQGGPPPPAFGHPAHAESHRPDHSGFQNDPEYAHKPTFRVYCRAESGKSLAIAHGKLLLVPADPSDPSQHWIKDEKFSTRVKDEEGFPSFSLINKATGQALKHATGAEHPVQLIPYNPNGLDESVLWTESKDTGDNYRTIRMVNNIKLNMDAAWSSDKHYGSSILLWKWKKGDNQRWKIVPYCNSHITGSFIFCDLLILNST